DGFDGTWVAHPDLVAVATECFDAVLGERPNQLERQRPEVEAEGGQLIDVRIPGGKVTEAGLRQNVSVGIQYVESWLRGNGAAAINNLMEDAATAEISRSQVWQWVRNGVRLAEGPVVDRELVRRIEDEELTRLRPACGASTRRTSYSVGVRWTGWPPARTSRRPRSSSRSPARITGSPSAMAACRRSTARMRASSSSMPNGLTT